MVAAKDAREWAASGGLNGLGDSLYTPFSGPDGDDIDWDAYRTLVRYCIGDLRHNMLWLTSGCGEFWALTQDERKKLLEVAIEEARAINPGVVIQACTSANCAKDCAELTQHAQEAGADIAYLQTPTMELHGGPGALAFFEYVARRTDIALGMFNSNASGYVLSGAEMAEIYHAIPAVVAVKEGVMDSVINTQVLHGLAPGIVIWECDVFAYEAGWLQDGVIGGGQLGNIGYLMETPDNLVWTEYWQLIWDGKLEEARRQRQRTEGARGPYPRYFGNYPGRPGYLTHWGEVTKVAAAAVGLPVGDYPYSRPPQVRLTHDQAEEIRKFYADAGMTGKALDSKALAAHST